MIYLIVYMPYLNELHSYCVIPYFFRYDLGFISRGFIGTIIRLFLPYLTLNNLWKIIFFVNIFLIIITSFICGSLIKKSKAKEKKAVIYLVALFFLNPSSISFLFYWGNYGRFDLFMIIIAIISLSLVIKNKYLILVPILLTSGIFIHQGFLFSYYPVVILGLLYARLIMENKKINLILILSLVVPCLFFIYFQFFGKINNYNYNEVISIMKSISDYAYFDSESMIKLEYFSNVFDNITTQVLPALKINVTKVCIVLIFLYPMLKVIYQLFKNIYYKKWEIGKLFFLIILICTIPKFILTCDYGRDLASIIICSFMMLAFLYECDNQSIINNMNELSIKITLNPMYYLFILILVTIIGKFEAANIINFAQKMIDMIWFILH